MCVRVYVYARVVYHRQLAAFPLRVADIKFHENKILRTAFSSNYFRLQLTNEKREGADSSDWKTSITTFLVVSQSRRRVLRTRRNRDFSFFPHLFLTRLNRSFRMTRVNLRACGCNCENIALIFQQTRLINDECEIACDRAFIGRL